MAGRDAVGLALHFVARPARADQDQARFAVGAVQRALRPAQDFDLFDLVEHGVAQFAKRNVVDVDRGAVDQKRIGFDAANRNEHVAELTHRVELHVRHELVHVAQIAHAGVDERLAVEHGHRKVALQIRRVALAAGDDDAFQFGRALRGLRIGLRQNGARREQRERVADEEGAEQESLEHGSFSIVRNVMI